jgi:hypothetical protein
MTNSQDGAGSASMVTRWVPDLSRHRGPRYRAIADALAADIANGRLASAGPMPRRCGAA